MLTRAAPDTGGWCVHSLWVEGILQVEQKQTETLVEEQQSHRVEEQDQELPNLE